MKKRWNALLAAALIGSLCVSNFVWAVPRETNVEETAVQAAMEGEGFETAEEALGAYIEGLKNNDIDQMLSAFAVESFVDHYSLVRHIERVQTYNLSMNYIPVVSDFSRELNIGTRRSEITGTIRAHYLALTGSPTVLGDNIGQPVMMQDYSSAQDMVDDLFAADDTAVLSSIEFDGEFIDPAMLSDIYADESNQENMKKQMAIFGGEDIASVAAVFTCNGDDVVLTADAIKYDGRWYLLRTNSNISNLLGIDAYLQGIMPLQGYHLEDLLAELE